MPSHRERVLQYLVDHPGRDDDEIALALNINPRQSVNSICRRLYRQGLVRRVIGPSGKLINYPGADAVVVAQARSTATAADSRMSEDQVKRTIASKLETEGWTVQVAWGHMRGIDIEATREGERWVIECKGTGSIPPMTNNYFVGVLGELLQRMQDRAKHSIAFPDLPKYRRLWAQLPSYAKERLQLTALFVTSDGAVHELLS